MLEDMGLRVLSETPYELRPRDAAPGQASVVYLYDLTVLSREAR